MLYGAVSWLLINFLDRGLEWAGVWPGVRYSKPMVEISLGTGELYILLDTHSPFRI